ncbi:hypothetical protein GTY80_35780, partial [Amycolatopsis sp. SID8362]|nr:hypothetical protein [Amycolatopsis sp. SID8362]NED45279.1 hypothetical protein [Amycolatopsis sp. SID8362]
MTGLTPNGSPIARAATLARNAQVKDTVARIGDAPDAEHRTAAECAGKGAGSIGQSWSLGFGDDSPPSTWWHGVDHPTMLTMITTNADVSAANRQAFEWSGAADLLPELADELGASLTSGNAHWQGPAWESAAVQFARIGHWVTEIAELAGTLAQQQSERAALLEETQRQMAAVPPVEFDARAADERLNRITDPVVAARQLAADQEQQRRQAEAHARAADLMTHFDTTLAAIGQAPTFPPPPLTATPPAAPAVPGDPPPDAPAPRHARPSAAPATQPASGGSSPAASTPPATPPPNPDVTPPAVVE